MRQGRNAFAGSPIKISGEMGSNGVRPFEGFCAFKNKCHLTAFSEPPEVNI
jgi:hypothetical protein